MSQKKVFIVGPGFIGWNVLDLLIAKGGYDVTGLVRREEHAAGIRASGATAVLGDLHDQELIASHVEASDIVFHTATADDLPSVMAVLAGVKKRAIRKQKTIYIHTSGTSLTDDKAYGEYKGEDIYYDDKPDQIDGLPDDAPHREIDLSIVRAAKEIGDNAKIAIMIPPEIYGFNPKHNRVTIQFPTIVRYALKHGFAGHFGKGLSVESQIHVMDLARAYMVLLDHMENSNPSEFLSNPYFFCENGKEFSWREGAEVIGKALYGAGKIENPEPREIPKETYGDLFGDLTGAIIGLNSRSRAVRLRKLGWEAQEKGIWESLVEDEIPAILAEQGRS